MHGVCLNPTLRFQDLTTQGAARGVDGRLQEGPSVESRLSTSPNRALFWAFAGLWRDNQESGRRRCPGFQSCKNSFRLFQISEQDWA